ncbi:MAG: tryptophan synthase subunit alpha [Cyanobacteria bacterium J06627_28]
MTTVSDRFCELKQQQKCALIPFIMAGDPDLATTAAALKLLDRSGADFIELGVPYSDPLADGPVIQAAATRALNNCVRLDQVIEMVSTVTPDINAPLILFTYYNPILNQGIELFLERIYGAGVRGLVIPDLPLEESKPLLETAKAQGIEVIMLVAPTSSPERMETIAQASQGFVYLVSVTGVTGMRSQVSSRIEPLLSAVRSHTTKPIGVGFGISGYKQAQQMKASGADAVIVGSAFVKRLCEPEQPLQSVEAFCIGLKDAISEAPAAMAAT